MCQRILKNNRAIYAIDMLFSVTLRELIEALKFYDEDTPIDEWDSDEYDSVIEYNSLIFTIMEHRAFNHGDWSIEENNGNITLKEDGVKIIYDRFTHASTVTIDGRIVYLNGSIEEMEE